MGSAQKRVSVVIPVYNAELYLAEAIESVLSQTLPAFEILVIDDGSTDGSAAIAKTFASSVQYFFKENQGPGSAINLGFNKATGDYFAVNAADDLWAIEKLSLQLAEFEADSKLDIVFTHLNQFISPELDEETRKQIYCPPDALPGYSAGTMLVKKEAFSRVGPFEDQWDVGEFIDWYARAKEIGLKSRMLDEVHYHRRLHTTNLTVRKRDSYTDYAKIIKASLDRRRGLNKG